MGQMNWCMQHDLKSNESSLMVEYLVFEQIWTSGDGGVFMYFYIGWCELFFKKFAQLVMMVSFEVDT